MILINQRLESKTTVSVLAHFLGTDHNIRAKIHRMTREGTKSLCTWETLLSCSTTSGISYSMNIWPQLWRVSFSSSLFQKSDLRPQCWFQWDPRVLRRGWEGILELQEQLKDRLGTEWLSSSSAEEFWVPVELEAHGALAWWQGTTAAMHTEQQLQGKHCSPLLGSSGSGIACPGLDHPQEILNPGQQRPSHSERTGAMEVTSEAEEPLASFPAWIGIQRNWS